MTSVRKFFSYLFLYLSVILLFLLVVLTLSFGRSFYRFDNSLRDRPDEEEILPVYDKVIDYIKGDTDYLSDDHFNLQDVRHLEDVRSLYDNCIYAIKISFVLSILFFAISDKKYLKKAFRTVMWSVVTAMLALIFLILTDFDSFWTSFHHFFFNNDLWLFENDSDFLIRIFPESFFLDLSLSVFILFGIALFICCFLINYRRDNYD